MTMAAPRKLNFFAMWTILRSSCSHYTKLGTFTLTGLQGSPLKEIQRIEDLFFVVSTTNVEISSNS